MDKIRKKFVIGVVVLFVFFLIYSSISESLRSEETVEVVSEVAKVVQEPAQPTPPPVRYFSQGSDTITISAADKVFYTDGSTILSYYANDGSVHFRDGDRAFVRILGITVNPPYTQNTEIFHPIKSDGSKDDTIFSGNISMVKPGKYLIKVCLGNSINLNEEGTMVWPFGCFEDGASEVVDVYVK